jgi:hypothetical protein
MNWKSFGRKQSWPLRGTVQAFAWRKSDSNQALPKCKSRVLPLQQPAQTLDILILKLLNVAVSTIVVT